MLSDALQISASMPCSQILSSLACNHHCPFACVPQLHMYVQRQVCPAMAQAVMLGTVLYATVSAAFHTDHDDEPMHESLHVCPPCMAL